MIPQQKIMETLDNLGLGHLNSIMGGPQSTTYHVIVGPNYGPNCRGVQSTSYPMSSTNCSPNFIGPQGTTYATVGPSCGPNFVKPFPQPYQMLPSPLIFERAHLPTMAPSHVHVPEQCMPIMFGILAFIVIGNETSTQLPKSKV